MKPNKIIAILPMRSGSQRIKNKNLRLLDGKPLYEHAIDKLLKIKSIEKIVINTDIQSVLDRYSIDKRFIVIKRDKNLCGNCDMNLVISQTLNSVPYKHFIQIHSTNPTLSTETINKVIKFYFVNQDKYDSVFSVSTKKKRFWDLSNKPINHDFNKLLPTQDLLPIYEENSCFYIFSRKSFLKHNNRIGLSPFLFDVPSLESLDVDYIEDLVLSEAVMKLIHNKL